MQITFPIPECARKERNLHCDVVHIYPTTAGRRQFACKERNSMCDVHIVVEKKRTLPSFESLDSFWIIENEAWIENAHHSTKPW